MNNKQLQTHSFNQLMDAIRQLIKCCKASTDSDHTLLIKVLNLSDQIHFEEMFFLWFNVIELQSSILTMSCFLVTGDNSQVLKKKSILNTMLSKSCVTGADKNTGFNFEIIFLLLA